MENQETAKMAAKSKMKLSATVLGLLALFGLYTEYVRKETPLDEATVIFVKGRAVAVEVLAEAAAPVAEPEQAAETAGVSAAQFLGYLREVSDRADAVTKPESALGQIALPQPEPRAFEAVPLEFNEQVIEIMNDNGEVSEVVEVREAEIPAETAETAATVEPETDVSEAVSLVREVMAPEVEALPAEASAEESVFENMEKNEPLVNIEENGVQAGEEGQAVDMMKEIIEREQAADGEK